MAKQKDDIDRDRMPFQVLVIPYRNATPIQYAAFLREDANYWQFIAGGGSRARTKSRRLAEKPRKKREFRRAPSSLNSRQLPPFRHATFEHDSTGQRIYT